MPTQPSLALAAAALLVGLVVGTYTAALALWRRYRRLLVAHSALQAAALRYLRAMHPLVYDTNNTDARQRALLAHQAEQELARLALRTALTLFNQPPLKESADVPIQRTGASPRPGRRPGAG